MTTIQRMMPGCEPYTEAEAAAVSELVEGAAEAEETIDLYELEEFARRMAFGAREVEADG